jgi:hypothetical protein
MRDLCILNVTRGLRAPVTGSTRAAGDHARHGVEQKTPPADAMTISEARSLVDILLARWLGNRAV